MGQAPLPILAATPLKLMPPPTASFSQKAIDVLPVIENRGWIIQDSTLKEWTRIRKIKN